MIRGLSSDLEKIIQAAKSGGQVLRKYFGQDLKIKEKSTAADFVTKADISSEETILKILLQSFPQYNVFTEESDFFDKKSEYTFIIDPLDGSNNFILGIPYFSVAIALLKNNEAILAVIYNPILDNTYYAEKGRGAWLKDKKLRVNNESDIKKASVVYTCNYKTPLDYVNCLIKRLNEKKVKRILTNWCPTLDFCLLASGKIEAIINNDNEIYDFIAGKLIAREARAQITDFQGNKETNDKNSIFLATNGTEIHEELLQVLPDRK
ncbi:inositol monophosphatase [Candidatus Microgenomates bacterium]|nr:inositol monophosphatase [Candidatus Microgenomates bacterium]